MERILKVLIISRNSVFIEKTENILIQAGFESLLAPSNPEDLQFLSVSNPDVILFDYQFPDINPAEFASTIKSDLPLMNKFIMLVYDENTPSNEIEKALNSGIDDVVTVALLNVLLVKRIKSIVYNRGLELRLASFEEKTRTRNIFLQEGINTLSHIAKSPNLYKSDINDFLHEITENTACHLNVDRVSVWFFNENKSKIVCNDLYDRSMQRHQKGDEISAVDFPVYFETIKKERIVAASDAANNETTREFSESYLQNTGIISMLDSPIRFKGEVSGVICVESIGEQRDWTPDEMNFSASVSDFLSLALEINESKKQEQKALESDELKSAFIANLSHKLRTPLNSISGFINLLSDRDLVDKELEHFISIINTNIQRLIYLVNDVVDISKIQTGQIQMMFKKEFLHPHFEDIRQYSIELLNFYHKNNLRFSMDLPVTDCLIETDSARLKQIFGYLIDNAIKFTSEGSVEIGYKVNPDQTVSFFVKDTGTGIPAEKSNNIFVPVGQFDQNYSRKLEGTGLGLVISNGLVALMHGSIWMETALGSGTTFWFKLPLSQGKGIGEAINTYPENPNQELNWKGKKILIVEDVVNNFELLEKMLHKTHVTIIWADTGELALRFFEANPDLDVVLMDIKLPDIDGLELTRQMKRQRPELPIVAQTAFAMSGDREKVLEAGCHEYLPKPISRIKLLRVLSGFIK